MTTTETFLTLEEWTKIVDGKLKELTCLSAAMATSVDDYISRLHPSGEALRVLGSKHNEFCLMESLCWSLLKIVLCKPSLLTLEQFESDLGCLILKFGDLEIKHRELRDESLKLSLEARSERKEATLKQFENLINRALSDHKDRSDFNFIRLTREPLSL